MMRSVASVYSDTRNEKLYCTLENIIKDMFTVAENDGCVSTDDRENEFQA